MFQPHFPSPSPAPTVFWGFAEHHKVVHPQKKASGKGFLQQSLDVRRMSASCRLLTRDFPEGHDGYNAEAMSVHLFHKPYWGALTLRGIKLVPHQPLQAFCSLHFHSWEADHPQISRKTSAKQISSFFWSYPCSVHRECIHWNSSFFPRQRGIKSCNTWLVGYNNFIIKVLP